MRSDHERILDIREAIDRINKYAQQGREAFDTSELIQTFIVHQLQILGEAAAGVSPELQATFQEVPWRSITGMRNILVHGYFEIDEEIVWSVVVRELPKLYDATEVIMKSFQSAD